MIKLLKIIFISVFILQSYQGINQTLQIANVQSCIGDTASVPLNMSAMDTVGAITLYISYDTAKVSFVSLSNINVLANGTLFNDVHNLTTGARLGKIAISWVTTTSGVTFSPGVFGILKFKVISGGCNINFLSNCEFVNYNTQVINVIYTNGSITVPTVPIIATQPLQLTLYNTQTGSFIIDASGYDNIQWQYKQGNIWNNIISSSIFQGVTNDTLIVNQPLLSLSGTYFRCKLNNYCFTTFSDSVDLIVNDVAVKEYGFNNCKIYPNPFKNSITVESDAFTTLECISIYQTDGKLLLYINVNKGNPNFVVNNLDFLNKGIYFMEVQLKNGAGIRINKKYKLIKL
ncbi:MAG: cohesin domain-containing protein [Bacteroidetes bacterium]|nr:cohesin domain-containing protein [Bacteroidota bacterium]